LKQFDFSEFATEINESTKNGYANVTPNHFVFSCQGQHAEVDWIGIDIGTQHFGICGLQGDYKTDAKPKLVWIALISVGSLASHFASDKICDILTRDPDFVWVRKAKFYRIELQVQVNPSAQIVACGIRSCFRTMWLSKNTDQDIPTELCEYVHGNKKYDVAPQYSEHAKNNPLRQKDLTGSKNKPQRKLLGEQDCVDILHAQGEEDMKNFLIQCNNKGLTDQSHDCTDSYLIARYGYEQKRTTFLKPPSVKRKRKVAKEEPVLPKKKRKTKRSHKFDYLNPTLANIVGGDIEILSDTEQ